MRPALVLCVACCVGVGLWVPVARAQTYPGTNKYYSGAGINGATTCQVTLCSSLTPCKTFEYRLGCGGNSSGACTTCTSPTLTNQYYSSSGGLANNCGVTAHKSCPRGSKTINRNISYEGDCVSCGPLALGFFYDTPTSPADEDCSFSARTKCQSHQYDANYLNANLDANCQNSDAPLPGMYVNNTGNPGTSNYFPKTTCPAGQKIKALDWSNPNIAGECESAGTSPNGYYYVANTPGVATYSAATLLCNMSSRYDSCKDGEYVSGCTNLAMGTCTPCSNGAAGYIYSGKGQWNNNCPVKGCTLPGCAADEYAAGCGVAGSTGLRCEKCTGAIVNQSFYFATGAYTPTSCTIQSCVACPAGKFKLGCGNTSPGTCEGCTNVN
jgi:hypothetical protein